VKTRVTLWILLIHKEKKLGKKWVKAWYFIQKNLTKKVQVKKRQFFKKTQESRFNFYLNFILKPWCFPLGLY